MLTVAECSDLRNPECLTGEKEDTEILISGNVRLFISPKQAGVSQHASGLRDPHRSERGTQTFPFQLLVRPVARGDQLLNIGTPLAVVDPESGSSPASEELHQRNFAAFLLPGRHGNRRIKINQGMK